MAVRLSRQKIAAYAADYITAGKDVQVLVQQIAGLLVEERRTREIELIIRSVYELLESKGVVVAEVVSARALTDATKKKIAELTNAQELHIQETVDSTVIGGMRVTTPTRQLDTTIARRIAELRAANIG